MTCSPHSGRQALLDSEKEGLVVSQGIVVHSYGQPFNMEGSQSWASVSGEPLQGFDKAAARNPGLLGCKRDDLAERREQDLRILALRESDARNVATEQASRTWLGFW